MNEPEIFKGEYLKLCAKLALSFLVKTAKAEKNRYLAFAAENIIEYVANIPLKEAKKQYGERGKIWNIIRS